MNIINHYSTSPPILRNTVGSCIDRSRLAANVLLPYRLLGKASSTLPQCSGIKYLARFLELIQTNLFIFFLFSHFNFHFYFYNFSLKKLYLIKNFIHSIKNMIFSWRSLLNIETYLLFCNEVVLFKRERERVVFVIRSLCYINDIMDLNPSWSS